MTILEMSLSATVLIIAIVVIRALALHKLPKKTFFVLWEAALCRLLIPFSIPSRYSVYTLVETLKSKALTIDTPSIVMGVDRADETSLADLTATLSPIAAVWLVGMSACAFFFLITHLRCRKEYKTALPVDNDLIERWLSEHPTMRKVQIRQSDRIATPLTYGIFRPVVLLPKTTDWADETALRYILTHEFVHIQRFDTLTKLLLASALCVHWFNPLAWVMYVLMNRDIELSCDETVVHTFGETMKSVYALTLIRLEEKKRSLTPIVSNFSKNAVEERIISIMRAKKNSLVNAMLALGLVISTMTIFATSAAKSAPVEVITLSRDEVGVPVITNALGIARSGSISSGTPALIPLEMGTNHKIGTHGALKEVEIQEASSGAEIVRSGIEHIVNISSKSGSR